ncbi:MAG TPA: TonB-dependent receptor [Flavobacteriales bacterium]|nr:TonB-dependent receptor [Flavobacteriales bacterium]
MLRRERLQEWGISVQRPSNTEKVMRGSLFIVVALFNSVLASGQVKITGRVFGDADTPLSGVNVVPGDDQAFGTTTDADGRFTLSARNNGQQRLRFSLIGHGPIDTLVTIDGTDLGTFRLHTEAVLMRSAEVTALRVGDRAPFAKSILTKEAIARTNTGVDLPYLLDLQPSVVSTSDAGTGFGYTYMRIRGTDGTRTNITVNGVPFNDAESQGAFLVNMPDLASSTEDIEVQRGVGTSTNGPAAFGASVNVRTTSVKPDPWGSVAISGGSFNTRRYNISAGTGLIDGRFSLDTRLSSIASDGYVDRASADLKSYFLQGAWMGKQRSLRLITFRGKEVTYQAWGGVPRDTLPVNRTYNVYTYENEVDNYDQTHYQLLFDQKLGTNATLNVTLFRVLGQGYFEQFREDDELSTYGIAPAVIDGDTITTSDIIRRRWLDNTLTGANISTDIKFGAHRLVVGGSYSDYGGAHFGEVIWARYAGNTDIGDRYYDDDARKTDANAFAKFTYAANDRIDLFGDAQVRQVDHTFIGYDNDLENNTQRVHYAFFNPKAGLLWRVHEGGKVYASVAIAHREPNREDLVETTPSSRPRPEQLVDYELGYERRAGRLSAGLNLYFMDYHDQLVLTGELNDVGAALRTNVARSYRAGAEFTVAAQLLERVIWRANFTISRNKVKDFTEYLDTYDADLNWTGQTPFSYSATDLPFSPNVILNNELAYRFWEGTSKGRAEITLVSKFVGQQHIDNTSSADRKLDPYFVNDLRANITLLGLKGVKSIDFNVTARNIFSELYESNGWVYGYVYNGGRTQDVGLYPQAPVNWLGGVTVRF